MKYISYDVEELVQDEDFIQWVKTPTPERDFFWNSFLAKFPEKRKPVFEARAIVESFVEEHTLMDKDEVLSVRNILLSNIRESLVDVENPMLPIKRTASVYLKIAASLLLILISVSAFYLLMGNRMSNEVAYIEKVSSHGQRSSVILPDGSRVWLNGGSRIKYMTGLENEGLREVFLEGEAFFDVAKDKSKPFIVNTNGIKIKVLGTKFNVKAYNIESTIETTLVEGSVNIIESEKNVILKPNEKAIFSKKEMTMKLMTVNSMKDYAWKEGYLIVENESFEETIQKLERWYGVDLELVGGQNCKINFKLSGETLEDVLKNLEDALKISCKKVKDRIVIHAINCN